MKATSCIVRGAACRSFLQPPAGALPRMQARLAPAARHRRTQGGRMEPTPCGAVHGPSRNTHPGPDVTFPLPPFTVTP